jgi:hypothetical protein
VYTDLWVGISFAVKKTYCDLRLLKIPVGVLLIIADSWQNFRISTHHKNE